MFITLMNKISIIEKMVQLLNAIMVLKNGLLRRVDGPAIEYVNGDKCWYQNGKLHRDDGHAVEWANGQSVNGYTQEQFEQWLKLKVFR